MLYNVACITVIM